MSQRKADVQRAYDNWVETALGALNGPPMTGHPKALTEAEIAARRAFFVLLAGGIGRLMQTERSPDNAVIYAAAATMELFGRAVGTAHTEMCTECVENNLQTVVKEFLNAFMIEAASPADSRRSMVQ